LCSNHSILVTSDWRTMRARSIFRLPQYQWSVAAPKILDFLAQAGGVVANGPRSPSMNGSK